MTCSYIVIHVLLLVYRFFFSSLIIFFFNQNFWCGQNLERGYWWIKYLKHGTCIKFTNALFLQIICVWAYSCACTVHALLPLVWRPICCSTCTECVYLLSTTTVLALQRLSFSRIGVGPVIHSIKNVEMSYRILGKMSTCHNAVLCWMVALGCQRKVGLHLPNEPIDFRSGHICFSNGAVFYYSTNAEIGRNRRWAKRSLSSHHQRFKYDVWRKICPTVTSASA